MGIRNSISEGFLNIVRVRLVHPLMRAGDGSELLEYIRLEDFKNYKTLKL